MLTKSSKLWSILLMLLFAVNFIFSNVMAQKASKMAYAKKASNSASTSKSSTIISKSHITKSTEKATIAKMESNANEFIEKGYSDLALSLYEFTFNRYPENLKVQKKLAWLYAWNKKYDQALDAFGNILQKDPENNDIQKAIAQVYGWSKKYDISKDKYRSILSRNPEDIEAMGGLAQVYAWEKKYDKSVTQYQKALKIASNDKALNKGLAQTLSWKGDIAGSIKQYGHVLSLYPQDVSARRELGMVNARNQNFDEAYRNFNKAVEIDTDDPDSYVSLATAARWDRRFNIAEDNYYRALRRKTNYKPAMDGLRALELARSLEINVGMEQDYLSQLYYSSAAYPITRKQDLRVSYSHLDRTYYFRNRTKAEVQHYFSLKTRASFAFAQTNYSYPEAVSPDNTSLTKSNEFSLQLNTFITRTWQVEVGYRFSQTRLFYWPDVTGKVHFLQFGLQKKWAPWLITEAGLAILHDFDPGVSDTLSYNDFTLFQGALFIRPLDWLDIDLRYIPNRDLDNSIAQTYMANTRLKLRPGFALRFRYRHDEYQKRVLIDDYLAGFEFDFLRRFKLMLAYKRINGPVKQGDYMFINLLTRIYEDL